jgi:hypothetical protein
MVLKVYCIRNSLNTQRCSGLKNVAVLLKSFPMVFGGLVSLDLAVALTFSKRDSLCSVVSAVLSTFVLGELRIVEEFQPLWVLRFSFSFFF